MLTSNYRAHLTHRVQLARAEVWVDPSEAWIEPLVEYVSQHVRPGERIFVYGHEAQLYFLTGRFYPWPYSQLYPGQEGGDGGAMLSVLLDRVPPKLVLRGVAELAGNSRSHGVRAGALRLPLGRTSRSTRISSSSTRFPPERRLRTG